MINSVLKAIDILSLFSASEPRLTLAEISSRLGLHKSTAHHLLASLLARGFVEKVDGDHYALGTAIVALTQGVRVNVELRDRAAPLLRSLVQDLRLTTYLTVPDGDYALYIYGVESAYRLQARTAVGDRAHMHCTAVGKAYLACLSPDEVAGIALRAGLPRFTANTITDLATLQEELARTRERGYSIDNQEHELRTFCIGAAIWDEGSRPIGSCSLSGADPEIVGARLQTLAPALVQCTIEVSRRMGYVPPRPSSLPSVIAQDDVG